MVPTQFIISNLSGGALALDAKLSEDRSLRRLIPANTSITVTPTEVTLEEMDRNPQIRQLINSGDISVSLIGGPVVCLRYDVAAEAGTDADTLVLGAAPFDMVLTGVLAEVEAGVATSTVTLSSGSTDYTDALDTDGTPVVVDAALQTARVIAAGTQLELDRSATAKAALQLYITAVRKSL